MSNLIEGIDTIIVRVSNLAVSTEWYRSRLEFEMLFEDKDNKLAVMDTHGPCSITLWESASLSLVSKNEACYPIFKTSDAGKLREQLLSLEVKAEDLKEDSYVKYFNFYDPDGNILEACEVKRNGE